MMVTDLYFMTIKKAPVIKQVLCVFMYKIVI